MSYQRPFVTSRFTAYAGDSLVRTLSLAVSLTDELTGQRPAGSFSVLLRERRGEHRRGQEPIHTPSGYFCFCDVPDGTYTLVVEPDAAARVFHLRPEAGGAWGPTYERAVVLPRPNPAEPVVELTLTPHAGYPFPPGSTLVRGRVTRGGTGVAGAVVRSAYDRATPTPVDPQATTPVPVENQSDTRGDYVLFFTAPAPAQQTVQVTGLADGQQQPITTLIREGRTTLNADIALP